MHVVIVGINSVKKERKRKRKRKRKKTRIMQPIAAIKGNPVIPRKEGGKKDPNSKKNSQNKPKLK